MAMQANCMDRITEPNLTGKSSQLANTARSHSAGAVGRLRIDDGRGPRAGLRCRSSSRTCRRAAAPTPARRRQAGLNVEAEVEPTRVEIASH